MIKKISVALMALCGLLPLQSAADEGDVSVGIGVGGLYSGLGVNIGIMRENDFRYVAAGCPGIGYSSSSGWKLPCGLGVGWITTSLVSDDHHHGIGIFIGPVGIAGSNSDNSKALYGVGVPYVYFFEGSSAKKWNAGITPAIGKDGGSTKGRVMANIGYQF